MRERWISVCLMLFIGLGSLSAVPAEAEVTTKPKAKIAIIIDDMGNDRRIGETALALPGAMTYSFLPHTPYGWDLATRAQALNKQVMLHLPMESHHGMLLGRGGVTLEMSKAQFFQTFRKALASVPYVSGVNNHMGSLLTRDPTAMRWLMRVLREKGLFFVDSRTTSKSLAEKVAKKNLVKSARRHVFLDNVPDKMLIRGQFEKLLVMARQKGSAIAIGHPRNLTIEVLAEQIPKLDAQGVELVHVSKLTHEGRRLWHAYSYPSHKDVKKLKQLPSPIF